LPPIRSHRGTPTGYTEPAPDYAIPKNNFQPPKPVPAPKPIEVKRPVEVKPVRIKQDEYKDEEEIIESTSIAEDYGKQEPNLTPNILEQVKPKEEKGFWKWFLKLLFG